jgi:hypothetical protein
MKLSRAVLGVIEVNVEEVTIIRRLSTNPLEASDYRFPLYTWDSLADSAGTQRSA